MKDKEGVWRLENWEPITQEDSDEQNDHSEKTVTLVRTGRFFPHAPDTSVRMLN